MKLSDTLDAYRADLESGTCRDVARKKIYSALIEKHGAADVCENIYDVKSELDRVERAVLGEVAA